jgi:hypothetical protein
MKNLLNEAQARPPRQIKFKLLIYLLAVCGMRRSGGGAAWDQFFGSHPMPGHLLSTVKARNTARVSSATGYNYYVMKNIFISQVCEVSIRVSPENQHDTVVML